MFFGLLVVITLATSRSWERLSEVGDSGANVRTLARIAIFTTAVIYVQLALGATMRHQHRDLAILDFPMAYGRLVPDISPAKLAKINDWRNARALSEVAPSHIWLQMAHRFLALVIAAGVVACLFNARRAARRFPSLVHFSDAWFLLLACQIALGAWVIWSNKAADIATTHVAVGASMLALGVTISAICLRLMHSVEDGGISKERRLPSRRQKPPSADGRGENDQRATERVTHKEGRFGKRPSLMLPRSRFVSGRAHAS
jgi:cytochrome c oxidase assembly protein subunit 15